MLDWVLLIGIKLRGKWMKIIGSAFFRIILRIKVRWLLCTTWPYNSKNYYKNKNFRGNWWEANNSRPVLTLKSSSCLKNKRWLKMAVSFCKIVAIFAPSLNISSIMIKPRFWKLRVRNLIRFDEENSFEFQKRGNNYYKEE